jgi:TRAP-type C4-dicarboxylate transport system permease small subunit
MMFLDKISRVLSQILVWFGGVFLVAMILLTCSNIFLRVVWIPVKGTFELMGFFGALVTAFDLGYTQIKRGHIAVDIVVTRFSEKTRGILNGVNYLVCFVFFAIASWRMAQWASTLWKTGEITETLRIVFYPFTYAVALGCFILALVLFVDFLKLLIPQKGV